MLLREFVASRLRELRAKHGLTQEQVAALLGTDVKWYQRVEWSAKDVRASTIDRLAELFGVTAIEFLAKDPPDTKFPEKAPGAPHKPRKAAKLKSAAKTKRGFKTAS
jgi:transcriptional regulator with XRE-family HTH domain